MPFISGSFRVPILLRDVHIPAEDVHTSASPPVTATGQGTGPTAPGCLRMRFRQSKNFKEVLREAQWRMAAKRTTHVFMTRPSIIQRSTFIRTDHRKVLRACESPGWARSPGQPAERFWFRDFYIGEGQSAVSPTRTSDLNANQPEGPRYERILAGIARFTCPWRESDSRLSLGSARLRPLSCRGFISNLAQA